MFTAKLAVFSVSNMQRTVDNMIHQFPACFEINGASTAAHNTGMPYMTRRKIVLEN
jgi:hypothetical protein